MKRCAACEEEKPLSDYYFEKGRPRAKCKVCHKKKAYEKRDADRDAFNASRRAYGAANREKVNAYQREYLASKRDEINERRRQVRAQNPAYVEYQRRRYGALVDKINADRRGRYAADPDHREVVLLRARKRRALRAGVEHQPYARSEIYERDGGRCRGCHQAIGVDEVFHIDHIVPISLGGPDIPANVQLMCPPCNCAKQAKLAGQIHMGV